jgi:hypothetical protein
MTHDLRKRVTTAAPTPTFTAGDIRQRVRRRFLRRRVSAGVVAFAIAGGGFGGLFLAFNPEGSRPTRPAARVDGIIRQAYLPITDARAWTVDQQRAMHEAQFLLVSRCMRNAGFEHPYVKFAPFPPSLDRRYGLKDPDAARKWGYGLPSSMDVDDSASQAYTDSLTPEERRAYEVAAVGSPDGQVPIGTDGSTAPAGCLGEARDTIYGSRVEAIKAEELRQMFQELEGEAYFASEGDQRVESVKDQWIDCMEGRGYDVSGLDDPLDASVLATGPEGGLADIELAMSVVHCNDATDLVEIWSGVEAEIQDGLLQAHAAEMQELLALREQAIANADRIVREGSAS